MLQAWIDTDTPTAVGDNSQRLRTAHHLQHLISRQQVILILQARHVEIISTRAPCRTASTSPRPAREPLSEPFIGWCLLLLGVQAQFSQASNAHTQRAGPSRCLPRGHPHPESRHLQRVRVDIEGFERLRRRSWLVPAPQATEKIKKDEKRWLGRAEAKTSRFQVTTSLPHVK